MTYKIVDVGPQGGEQWLSWRKGKISASIIASIMGLDPWVTPLQRYNMILNDESIPDNAAMSKGRELEPIAREYRNSRIISSANYQPVCMERTDFPWMIASLDGWDSSGEPYPLELKCGGEKLFRMAEKRQIPEYYKCQLAWQMWVSCTDVIEYGVWWENPVHSVELPYISIYEDRDEAFTTKMVIAAKDFYNRLLNFDPPEPCDRDYVEIEDDAIVSRAKYYQDLCEKIAEIEQMKEIERDMLIEACSNRNSKIGPLKLTKVKPKPKTDYKGAALASGINLDDFKTQCSEYWRIS